MNLDLPQADQYLGTHTLRLLGGVRTYGARLTFYLGFANTATLMFLIYKESTFVNSLFPSVLAWLGFILFVCIPIGLIFDYGLAHPAQIAYVSNQQAQTKRNPLYERVVEVDEKLDRVEARLDECDTRSDGGYTYASAIERFCR